MPRKIRELISDLKEAGFWFEPGKGSHRKYRHSTRVMVVLSGQIGGDARHYQEKEVRDQIKEAKNREKK